MAGLKLDAAGTAKMKTLDEALLLQQRINGLVEQYAMAVKRNTNAGGLLMSIKRQLPTLAANLKAQFGLVSEQVTAVLLSSSRGAADAPRVRALREGMAQIKQSIEIAMTSTKDKHMVRDAHPAAHGESPS